MRTKNEYTRLGSTGLKVSRLCLGAMTYGSKEWRLWAPSAAATRPDNIRFG
ncbi:MAG TPA: hypothetical protein VHY84_20710 [Bryobacteraceae bacterium]|jgi:aryl-alcohol dehydrogenase (NADP+)|nr:hypothetical protein [Bryobacteraceae bacterium]